MKKITQILVTLLLCLALAAPTLAETVNINKADQEALQYYLHGIGEVKAKAIVDYRRKHGRFKSIDDLLNVPGVGEATLQKIRRNISLSSGVTKAPKKAVSKKGSAVSKSRKSKSKSAVKSRASSKKKSDLAKSKSRSKSKSKAAGKRKTTNKTTKKSKSSKTAKKKGSKKRVRSKKNKK